MYLTRRGRGRETAGVVAAFPVAGIDVAEIVRERAA